MTIALDSNKVVYTGNGVSTVFPFSFRVDNASDLVAYLLTTATGALILLTQGVDYTVSGIPGAGGVTYNPGSGPMPATQKLIIIRIVPLLQGLDINNQGGFYPETLEAQLDTIVMGLQQLEEGLGRAVQSPVGQSGYPLPTPVSDAYIGWDHTASALENKLNIGGTTLPAVADTALLRDPTNQFFLARTNAQFKTWLATTAADVSFTQAGVGAIASTAEAKLRGLVSITDFGAIGDGNIANAATNATALANALATGKQVWIPWTAAGYHFGTNQVNVPDNGWVVGESMVTLKSTATTSLLLMSGGGTGTVPNNSGASNLTIDMAGSGASSGAFLMNTLPGGVPTPVSHIRLSNLKFMNCVAAYKEPAGGGYVYDLQLDNIECVLIRGTQIDSRRTQGFIRVNNVNVNETLTGQTSVTYPAITFTNFAGLELYQIHVTGQAAALGGGASFIGNATGINLTGTGTAGTAGVGNSFVWMDRCRAESCQGGGMLITNVSFIDGKEVETRGCLGNGVVLTQVYWYQFTSLYASGAKGLTGAAASAHGIAFDTCGQSAGVRAGYGGGTIIGMSADNCTGNGILVRDTMGLMAAGVRAQDNTGWGLQETNSVAGYVDFNTYLALDAKDNTAGNLSLGGASSRAPSALLGSVRDTSLPGTKTNNSAVVGDIGEYVETVVAIGSAVALVSTTPKDFATISLTAGDWDVELIPEFTGNTATTLTYVVASLSSGATNVLDQTNGRYVSLAYAAAGPIFNNVPNAALGLGGITCRMSLNATTTIRAVAQALFATNTCSAYGVLRARRVR